MTLAEFRRTYPTATFTVSSGKTFTYRHMCEVADLLKKLAVDGKTIFVSTHDPELIALCCDRVIRITDGHVTEVI